MTTTTRQQTTHTLDPETGHLRQIVPPATLRAVLDAEGSDDSRPADFDPEDEWRVED